MSVKTRWPGTLGAVAIVPSARELIKTGEEANAIKITEVSLTTDTGGPSEDRHEGGKRPYR